VESRALNSLSRQGIKVYPVTTADKSTISFAVAADDERNANAILTSEFAPELVDSVNLKIKCTPGLSTVALVGSGLKSQPGLSARVRNSLMRGGIHVAAFSDGGSDSTLTFMLAGEDADNALKIIHSMFC
ncbi:MAG: hypothetical protein K2H15_09110, partial [Muribaculaceae bacterium]|nr:hypothetical protein [Muribaculaceae bacterium]